MSGSSASGYLKAVANFDSFISGRGDEAFSEQLPADWAVWMSRQGLSLKTARHYIDIVSGLYGSAVSEGLADETDAFSRVKALLKERGEELWRQPISEDDFSRLQALTKVAGKQTGESALAADLLLFSLLNRVMDLAEVASLRREDLSRFGEESRAVAERHADARRKFIFPLDQSHLTPRQLEKRVAQMVADLLGNRNIAVVGSVQDTVRSYWAYAALRCGATAAEVAAALGRRPAGMPILGLCTATEAVSEKRLDDLARSVGELFVANPVNWYAMRLRPGVKFSSLERRFVDLAGAVATPELFYPCDEIAKRVRKKLVYEQKPVLPDIVFFKSRLTDILPLFAKIGDIAWCYKHDGSYASISKGAMELFQRTIGKFTPDYEVGPEGSLELRQGDRIVVLGGPFAGRDGELLNEPADAPNVIYRIRLFGGLNDIEWRVNDPRLITKHPQPAV